MEMCTGYPVVIVVVVAKEMATTESNAMMPMITKDGDMVFDRCTASTKKSIKNCEATFRLKKIICLSDNRLLGQ